MLPKKGNSAERSQQWTVSQLFGLAKRNPFMISHWVLLWAVVGTVSGLFAALYWNILELITHKLQQLQGPSLLVVMPCSGLVIGLIIHFLGNPGEIAVIVDNIHFRGGRLDTRKNPSMILASPAPPAPPASPALSPLAGRKKDDVLELYQNMAIIQWKFGIILLFFQYID